MTFSIHGLAVSRGIAIGRAVLVASSRADVAHYFIDPSQVSAEIDRVRLGRNTVVEEIQRLQTSITHMGPKEAPHELTALLDVHLMLLKDVELVSGVKHWITDRLYNAEWALTTQLEVIARQFDEMEDEYLRERKADLEQVVERVLRLKLIFGVARDFFDSWSGGFAGHCYWAGGAGGIEPGRCGALLCRGLGRRVRGSAGS